jgi:hypothetical protein
VKWIGSKLYVSSWFDGIVPMDTFLVQMEKIVPIEKILQTMDFLVHGTPT